MEKVNVQIREKAIKEYLNSNVSLATVAKRYGVTKESVRLWVLGSGHKPRAIGTKYSDKTLKEETKVSKKVPLNERNFIKLPCEQRFNNNVPWTLKDDDTLKEALLYGFTVKEVSELLGRSITSIYTRKTILTYQGFIKKGLRFKHPKGILRKKSIYAKADPEVSETNRLIKKYTKINEAGGKKEESQPPAEGIKKVRVKEVKNVQMVIMDKETHLNVISLEDLAEIVKKHGISVSISILKNGTEIHITK